MIAKCVLCGTEYQLDDGENPQNFQCDCGGALMHAINQTPSNKTSSTKKGISKNHKTFIYSILMVITLDIIWALYIIPGIVQGILSLLIPVYIGYNLPKDKIIKYIMVYSIVALIILTILGGGVSPFSFVGIIVFLVSIGVNIVLGYIGMYLKRFISNKNKN
ncbi:MAG: hypothetical protein FGO69_08680 [Methanobacterium sp.]|nr:MAG: hypothetical protein FGO69_08680 [Methanobacterium sp.]